MGAFSLEGQTTEKAVGSRTGGAVQGHGCPGVRGAVGTQQQGPKRGCGQPSQGLLTKGAGGHALGLQKGGTGVCGAGPATHR